MIEREHDIDVRAAREADAPTIHRMLSEMAAVMGRPDEFRASPDDLSQALGGDRPRINALLATTRQRAIGLIIWFYQVSTWNGYPGMYVQDLFVVPSMHGSGLGRRLLVEASATAWREGARYMRLSVYNENRSAAGFYRALGFASADDERLYELKGEAFRSMAGVL